MNPGSSKSAPPPGGQEPVEGSHRLSHVILTRFNVRYVDDPTVASIGVDPEWLEKRFILFERYCLPSILSQTNQDFRWLIFFDSETPANFKERVQEIERRSSNIHAVYCSTLPLSLAQEAVRSHINPLSDWVLTTRIDNDDGIGPDFVETLQKSVLMDTVRVYNFPVGIILRGNRAYRREDRSNAFISLCEPANGAQTIFAILRHIDAQEFCPVIQLSERPSWLQVIHETNISNRIRGDRIPYSSAQIHFRPILTAWSSRRTEKFEPISILYENVTLAPFRKFRDMLVIIARKILRYFGINLRRRIPVSKQHR